MSGLCVWRVTDQCECGKSGKEVEFEVVGEGSVTVTDVEDCIRTVQSGSEITVLMECVYVYNRMQKKTPGSA